ncbi:MAG: acyl-CoA thioesterase [Candidatus Kapabacteria bacterium]|nr:acyl-CoA thioesterase [Candidatus Kapabacteria bacterium]
MLTDNCISHGFDIRVRYSDTDQMGVVYYGNYPRFFEIGRTEFLRSIGLPYATLEADGFQLPVLELHARYHKPARYDDLITVEATLDTEALGATFEIEYVIRRSADVLVTGSTKHAFVRAGDFQPVRPPHQFRQALETAALHKRQERS